MGGWQLTSQLPEFLSLQNSPRERISSVSGWSSPSSSPWRSRRSLSWFGLVCQGSHLQRGDGREGNPLPQNGRGASLLPWRIRQGVGGDEAGRGKGGLAKGREEVDPKAVEGTNHPFAPPEKVSRVAPADTRWEENYFPPVGLLGGRGVALDGEEEGSLGGEIPVKWYISIWH